MFPRLLVADVDMSLLHVVKCIYIRMIRDQLKEDSNLQQEMHVLNSEGDTICRITESKDLPLSESTTVCVEESSREDPKVKSSLGAKVRFDCQISFLC